MILMHARTLKHMSEKNYNLDIPVNCTECYEYFNQNKGKGSLYSFTERRVPELIRFLAVSQVT